jgi:hypothetical protein
MIQDCQDRVFSTYRDQRGSELSQPTSVNDIPLSSKMESINFFETQPSIQSGQSSFDMSRLGSFYGRPPLQTTTQTNSNAQLIEMPLKITESSSSDSGYVTDLPAPSLDYESSDITPNSSQSQTLNGSQVWQADSRLDMSSRLLPSSTRTDPSLDMFNVGNMDTETLSMNTGYAYNPSVDFDFEKFLARTDSVGSRSDFNSSFGDGQKELG